ncbi:MULTISPECIES: DUF4236 domain-containing protein [Pseudomonas]|uniref:DUF4236 domain-containing protein n=1 Tax=Pseudomonas TaxID=286 RepID=UPI00037C68C4|nr:MULTISPECIES: DUF4236 domain-containing protein [Pseudomonas]ANC81004.1 hypothetical protein KKK_08245 [Pseudomonas putida B6-2]NQD57476.1 DUF4236 domain-containing protein [Pseudomonas sp. CM25]
MAIRFRKSFKIAPGLRLNVSKTGVSASIGRKGAMVNVSKRGTRVTAGLPGTGLSASHLFKAGGSRPNQVVEAPTFRDSLVGLGLILLIFAFFFIAFKAPWLLVALIGVPVIFLMARSGMRAADLRRQKADPTKYWAERSRKIQEDHRNLPDA